MPSLGVMKAIGVLALLALLGIFGGLLLASEKAQGHAEGLQQCQREKAEADERQAAADAQESQRRTAAQTEIANETQRLAARDRARLDADAAAAGAAGVRLRDHVAAAVAAATSDPAATGQCAATATALGELFESCRSRYADLGRQADGDLADARRRSSECAARYDALTPPVKAPAP